jgi:cupin fold WbuC family metalloprotein
MMYSSLPELTREQLSSGLAMAAKSPRRRHPHLLHSPGAEFNMVFNFIMSDSYMQPHLHPGSEKIEKIHIVQGRIAVLYFDDQGSVTNCTVLKKGGVEFIEVPAFTWHTYVMLTEDVVSYETMMGVYNPSTWKKFAPWAPAESATDAGAYLTNLKIAATSALQQ